MSGGRRAEVTRFLYELKGTLQTVVHHADDATIVTGVNRYLEVIEATVAQLPGAPAVTGERYWSHFLDDDLLRMSTRLNETQNAVQRKQWFEALRHSSSTLAALPGFPLSHPHRFLAELDGCSLSKWLKEPGKPS